LPKKVTILRGEDVREEDGPVTGSLTAGDLFRQQPDGHDERVARPELRAGHDDEHEGDGEEAPQNELLEPF
jgi:hypothetical protein